MSFQDLDSSRLLSIHALQVSSAPPLTFVISGPSGVGKDAVIKQLQQTRPELHFVVTATSRQVLQSCLLE